MFYLEYIKECVNLFHEAQALKTELDIRKSIILEMLQYLVQLYGYIFLPLIIINAKLLTERQIF